uniref:Uncharacterized protein n=1 Tax=Glossina pallidipes TaxID=7398 RepID=A0A1B0AAD7_GLOPL
MSYTPSHQEYCECDEMKCDPDKYLYESESGSDDGKTNNEEEKARKRADAAKNALSSEYSLTSTILMEVLLTQCHCINCPLKNASWFTNKFALMNLGGGGGGVPEMLLTKADNLKEAKVFYINPSFGGSSKSEFDFNERFEFKDCKEYKVEGNHEAQVR